MIELSAGTEVIGLQCFKQPADVADLRVQVSNLAPDVGERFATALSTPHAIGAGFYPVHAIWHRILKWLQWIETTKPGRTLRSEAMRLVDRWVALVVSEEVMQASAFNACHDAVTEEVRHKFATSLNYMRLAALLARTFYHVSFDTVWEHEHNLQCLAKSILTVNWNPCMPVGPSLSWVQPNKTLRLDLAVLERVHYLVVERRDRVRSMASGVQTVRSVRVLSLVKRRRGEEAKEEAKEEAGAGGGREEEVKPATTIRSKFIHGPGGKLVFVRVEEGAAAEVRRLKIRVNPVSLPPAPEPFGAPADVTSMVPPPPPPPMPEVPETSPTITVPVEEGSTTVPPSVVARPPLRKRALPTQLQVFATDAALHG